MGCYPLFVCKNWSGLSQDLKALKTKIVSLALVTDPLGNFNVPLLNNIFPDFMIPFKQHFIVDLEASPFESISNHHKRYAKRALKSLVIEQSQNPKDYLDEWINLYLNLVKKHNIINISKFSRKSFIKQFDVPGMVLFRALYKDSLVGMIIWFTHENRSYYHLSAYSDLGYELTASFGLFWHSIEYFKNRVEWLCLGGGAGVEVEGKDGLSKFKHGWSNKTITVYVCGKIFNPDLYKKISSEKNKLNSQWFPAYREGEYY